MLALAACSSGGGIDAADTTETADTAETMASEPEGDGADGDDALIETETETMGEDDIDPTGSGDGSTSDDEVDDGESDEQETDDQGVESSAIDDGELAAALEAGQSDLLGLPFMYVTAEQDCDGCAEAVSLYYVPGPVQASVLVLGGAFVDGDEVDLSEVDPSLVAGDPRLVAEQLAAATDVAYSIDPVSGLVTGWTIGGDSVTLRCLQVDTRPIELRSEVCRDSLIG